MANEDENSGGGSGGFWGRLFGRGDEPEAEPIEEADADNEGGFFSDSFDALAGAFESATEAAGSALKKVAESDPDHDGLTTAEELEHGSDPRKADSDLDGLPDREEYRIGSDPMDPADPSEIAGRFFGGIPPEDDDNGFLEDSIDQVTDVFKSAAEKAESAFESVLESDPDHDLLRTGDELRLGTDPFVADSDGDGTDDGIEYLDDTDPLDPAENAVHKTRSGRTSPASDDPGFFGDPLGTIGEVVDDMTGGVASALVDEIGEALEEVGDSDPDGDGLSTADEIRFGTDPNVDDGRDIDGDHIANSAEIEIGTDPTSWDTDGDGLSDFAEHLSHRTDPNNPDTDLDGVSDFVEINIKETDPLKPPSGPGRLRSAAESVLRSSPDATVEPSVKPDDAADDGESQAPAADTGESLSDEELDDFELDDDDFEIPSGDPFSQTQDDDFDGITNDMDEMGAVFAGRNIGGTTDADHDGLTDVAEAKLGTDPNNRDTDGDKMPDLIEVRLGTDPLVADPIPAMFADEGPSDGTERGDLLEGMGKAEAILKDRDNAAWEAALAEEEAAAQKLAETKVPVGDDELLEPEMVITDPALEGIDEVIAELDQQAITAPEVVVEEPAITSDEPTDTFESIDTSVDSLLIDSDEIDGD